MTECIKDEGLKTHLITYLIVIVYSLLNMYTKYKQNTVDGLPLMLPIIFFASFLSLFFLPGISMQYFLLLYCRPFFRNAPVNISFPDFQFELCLSIVLQSISQVALKYLWIQSLSFNFLPNGFILLIYKSSEVFYLFCFFHFLWLKAKAVV